MQKIVSLGHAEAQKAIAVIQAEMLKRGKAGVIAVADAHGELLGLLRLDGAPLPSIQIATNKAYTAARERKPSREIGQAARNPEKGFDIAYYGDPKILGWGGGLPVVVEGAVVGRSPSAGCPKWKILSWLKWGLRPSRWDKSMTCWTPVSTVGRWSPDQRPPKSHAHPPILHHPHPRPPSARRGRRAHFERRHPGHRAGSRRAEVRPAPGRIPMD